MVLTVSLYFQVAVSRFIDDMSTLAIEDCLISKLSTLFRSTNVSAMSEEGISSLVGETQESALERKRLEAKRGILETGLKSLKSLHKRRNVVEAPQQDQLASDDSEQVSAMTPSRSQKASVTTDSAEEASEAIGPHEPSYSPPSVEPPPLVDEWSPRAKTHDDMEEGWPSRILKKKREKVSRHGEAEEPLADPEWGR